MPIATVAATARILHLTDPHLFADPGGVLRGATTYETLRDVLDHYRQSGWGADIAYVTGDLIQDDSALAYEHFCELLAGVGLPVYCLPGNHDIPDLMQDVLERHGFNYRLPLDIGAWHITPVDTFVGNTAGGFVSVRELQTLEKRLQTSEQANVLVAMHHPPVKMGSRWLDGVGLGNADELLAVLSRYAKVRGIIFGHVHQSLDKDLGGMRIIGTPSTCAQFLPHAEDFAVDDRPPAYRRLTLGTDGSLQSELVWLDN